VWREANPGFDDIVAGEDFEASLKTTPENEFRIKRTNVFTAAETAWLPFGAWADCTDSTVLIPDASPVVLAFDGSYDNDATALVVCSVAEKPHLDVVRLWESPGEVVPILEVEAAIREACARWQVREIACDPYRWARSMQILEDERLPVVAFPQNAVRMTPATQRFYEAVLNHGLTHSGDTDLARHLGNAVLKVDSRGQRLTKETKQSSRRIDLAVAAVMALERAKNVPEPAEVSVWFA
jgi:phage terminase large subunit-like protein